MQLMNFQHITARGCGMPLAPRLRGARPMIEFEVHPEIHIQKQLQRPAYSTCRDCHRTFRPKSEDQLSLELCDTCCHALRVPEEAVPSCTYQGSSSPLARKPQCIQQKRTGKKRCLAKNTGWLGTYLPAVTLSGGVGPLAVSTK